jgi:hypothetical protein
MPRYLVERSFPEGLAVPTTAYGAAAMAMVIANNASEGVTWVQSYVTADRRCSFCIYDGPSPESIQRAALLNQLPVGKITEVRVLDPYFYHHQ